MEIIISAISESLLKKIGKQIEKAIDEKKKREFFENFKNLHFLAETEDFYKEEINKIFSNTKLAKKIFESATSTEINSHQQVFNSITDAVASYYSKNKSISINIHSEIIELLKTAYLYLFLNFNKLDDNNRKLFNQLCRNSSNEISNIYEQLKINSEKHDKTNEKLDVIKDKIDNLGALTNENKNIDDVNVFEQHYTSILREYERKTLSANRELKLKDYYIEPSFENGEVIGKINEWLDSYPNVLFVIGEAGQGKSTLGLKLLYDFITKEILLNAIDNMVYIKLTNIITEDTVRVEQNSKRIKSISFEVDGAIIELSQQKNILVYLDGYDEALDVLKKMLDCSQEKTEKIFVDYLSKIKNVKFIVTSRGNYITEYISKHTDDKVITHKLRELSDKEIISWISEYNEKTASQYTTNQNELKQNEQLYELMKIPLLLQLVVINYMRQEMKNRTELYTDLFDKIFKREKDTREDTENFTKEQFEIKLSELAMKLHFNDKNPVELDIDDEFYKAVVFHFYTQKDNKKVDFLHNSFYQYFLAAYIVGLMIKKDYMALFECLGKKNLFFDELTYILDYQKKYSHCIDFSSLIDTIENTNCIPDNLTGNNRLEKAERSFVNTINIIIENFKSIENGLPANRFVKSLKAYNCVGLDLSFADLSKAKLVKMNFTKCNLIGANLNYTELKEADLSNAKLLNANLSNAKLINATLKSAFLQNAILTSATLKHANLKRANLHGAVLINVNFVQATINLANLTEANLTLANLSKSNLTGTKLTCAVLSKANLNSTNLSNANLTKANLTDSKLINATLIKANLTNADLTGADLTGANLTGAILRGAIFDQYQLSPKQLSQAIL